MKFTAKMSFKHASLSFFLSFIFFTPVFAQSTTYEISYEQYDVRQWDKILARQKELNRCIMIYAYSDNSKAWKMMQKKTLHEFEVTDYFSGHFVNVLVNMDSAYSAEFGKKYQVNCYPTFIIIDPNGEVAIQRTAGFLEPKDFLAFGASHTNSFDHANKFIGYKEKFESHTISYGDVVKYLELLSKNCFAVNDTAVEYLNSKQPTVYMQPINWKIIHNFVTDVESAPFKYLVTNRKDFAQKFGLDTVNDKIYNAYLQYGRKLAFTDKAGKEKISAYKSEVAAVVFERSAELESMLDLTFAEAKEDWKQYYTVAKSLIEKYRARDASFLNNVSRKLLEKSTNKKYLADALIWAKKATDIKPVWENEDTYAQLLFKTGNKQQAIDNEIKAIEMAKTAEDDTVQLRTTLDNFKAAK